MQRASIETSGRDDRHAQTYGEQERGAGMKPDAGTKLTIFVVSVRPPFTADVLHLIVAAESEDAARRLAEPQIAAWFWEDDADAADYAECKPLPANSPGVLDTFGCSNGEDEDE